MIIQPSFQYARTARLFGTLPRSCISLLIRQSLSTSSGVTKTLKSEQPTQRVNNDMGLPTATKTKFCRLPTAALIRGVILGTIFKRNWILKPALWFMRRIAQSKSPFLSTDTNIFLWAMIYPFIYKQFCAGRNKAEIQQTVDEIKRMGYSGVILCYAKEIMADSTTSKASSLTSKSEDAEISARIKAWRDGNLQTLESVGKGDYVGIKLTGADVSVSADLIAGRPMRPDFLQAFHDICEQARNQGSPLWIDAEEQKYHPGIDNVAIDFMQKYNREGQVVVLTTIQAYLKRSRDNVEHLLRLAGQQGWTLGIKLVRGAYIGSDTRENIHDTKADTDSSYNGIAHGIMRKSWPGIERHQFPKTKLFLAGHNHQSIEMAFETALELARAGKLAEPVEYGHLQGMADDIGCEILERCDQTVNGMVPAKLYKCLTWGTVQECLHYLVRRAIENEGATGQLNAGHDEMLRELKRRFFGVI